MAFHRDGLSVPQELQVATEVALSQRVLLALRSLEQEWSDPAVDDRPLGLGHLTELEAIAREADQLRCRVHEPEAKQTLERLILQSLRNLLVHFNPATLEEDMAYLERLIRLGHQLHLGLSLAAAQELYFDCLHDWIIPECLHWLDTAGQGAAFTSDWADVKIRLPHLRSLLRLGQTLAIDVAGWLAKLP